MFDEILTKIFGSRNDRLIKQYRRKVEEINKLEPAMKALSDDELRAKTQEFRDRIAKGATTDDLLVEAFAVVREAAQRVLGMRHFDVQLIGGMVLNDGKIAEMRTGEGKTLTATLAVYLNALPGKLVHLLSVHRKGRIQRRGLLLRACELRQRLHEHLPGNYSIGASFRRAVGILGIRSYTEGYLAYVLLFFVHKVIKKPRRPAYAYRQHSGCARVQRPGMAYPLHVEYMPDVRHYVAGAHSRRF